METNKPATSLNAVKGRKGFVTVPLAERIESRIQRVPFSGCWIWIGSTSGTIRTRDQRPIIQVNGKRCSVYRLLYEIENGAIQKNMFVCHTCDVPLCVNPDHLFIGTNSANQIDSFRKGRHAWWRPVPITHCKRGHEFTPENTKIIHGDERNCKTCMRAYFKTYNANRSKARAALAQTKGEA